MESQQQTSHDDVNSLSSILSLSDTLERAVPVIEFHKISKPYEKSGSGVEEVSMKILPGKCTVLLGHHGCGKSTLIGLLCGNFN